MPIFNVSYQSGASARPDHLLLVTGPSIPVQIEVAAPLADSLRRAGAAVPTPVEGIALFDTGAGMSAIDMSVITRLGVQPVGVANVGTAGGVRQQALYPGRLVFPGTRLPDIEFSRVFGADLSGQTVAGFQQPLIALVGRDVLSRFVLIYNGPLGGFTLAY